MANRRMFSSEVVCTDKFLDMPSSSQALYFQFGMKADDDGFISAPRQIARMANASDDDLRILLSKGYLIPFDSGVLVIKDWHVNNYLRKDRYTETRYLGEKSMLDVVNSEYVLSKKTDTTSCTPCGIPSDNHSVTHTDTQERVGKDRKVEDRVVPDAEIIEPKQSYYSRQKEICEKNRENGRKGGLAKASKYKQSPPSAKQGLANLADRDIGRDSIDYQQIADLYNETCVSFPRLNKLSDSRKKAIKARLKQYGVDDFHRMFEMAEGSEFLKGKNDRNWSATFDWMIKDANMAKILDGNYTNRENSTDFRAAYCGDDYIIPGKKINVDSSAWERGDF